MSTWPCETAADGYQMACYRILDNSDLKKQASPPIDLQTLNYTYF